MASQRYIFVASHTFFLLFPLAISWDALFLVFCFLLSCSDSFFLSFVGAYHQSMVNVGAAKIRSSKVKARAINTNSWLLELFLSLECHNITSTVNLLAYELTLLWYHQQTCKLIKDFSLPTFFWFGKL